MGDVVPMFQYDRNPDPGLPALPDTVWMVRPADGADVEWDEDGYWIPQVGDPVTVTTVHLERYEEPGSDLPFYRIGPPVE